ncbi:MAG: flagellar motor switch protein FliM, partial [Alphaproteobacteria bacterium]
MSNEELETLLSAVDVGDVPTGGGQMQARQKRVSSYDFRKPNRFSRDQLRVLQYMHKNAAQLISSDLSSMLRIGVEVQLVSIGQITYDAFSASLADPICINILSLDPLDQLGVLAVDLPLAFAVMERMLGGPGQIPNVTRPLTMLEETIVSQVIELILNDLNQSWESLIPLKLKVERRE